MTISVAKEKGSQPFPLHGGRVLKDTPPAYSWKMSDEDFEKMCKLYNIFPKTRTMLSGTETTFILYAC